jgi:2-polyprenyl-3-methyl-5-hydroxy-6-metoxy-1,4-benzoquinol methylase
VHGAGNMTQAQAGAIEVGEFVRRYPSIERFSRDIGLPSDKMATALEMERRFHRAVLSEQAPERRRALYTDIYARIFEVYGFEFAAARELVPTPRDGLVELLMPELRGRSILDVGCGAGEFLISCARLATPKRLIGLDLFVRPSELPEHRLTFIRGEVIDFALPEKVDVVISDNLYEHIAPQDVPSHLASIRRVLQPGGTLILLTPNRHFGPWDVTRIIDDSYSGRTPAQGTHVNETTYTDLLPQLSDAGFERFRSLWPMARSRGQRSGARVPSRIFALAERIRPLMRRLQAVDKRARLTDFEISVIAAVR